MKLLIVSDAGCHTGFAQVAHQIGDRLVDKGWDVHVIAANYKGDYWPTKMKLYPASLLEPMDFLGGSRIIEMLAKVMPDAVLFINDPYHVLSLLVDNRFDSERVLWNGYKVGETVYKPPVFAYTPIDGYDSPKSWDLLDMRVRRIAMSHFGSEQMDGAPVVWHGVDTSIYKPMNKKDAKRAMGYDPDRFLILRVDKNSIRKDYPATWKALRPLLRKYTDIDVHWHCLPRTKDGYDLRSAMYNDEDVRDRVNYSTGLTGFTGWPEERLAILMAAADLYVSTSWGEGFGLGLLQALACGTAVVAQDCSSITEVVGPGGMLIPPKDTITTPMGQDQCLPDIDQFTSEIEHLYKAGGVRRKLAAAGVKHAAQFSWDYAGDRFDELLRSA